MTSALLASLVLSAVCGVAVAGLFLAWPRRLRAEEWVLQRRAAAISSQPTVGATVSHGRGRTTPAGWFWRGRARARGGPGRLGGLRGFRMDDTNP